MNRPHLRALASAARFYRANRNVPRRSMAGAVRIVVTAAIMLAGVLAPLPAAAQGRTVQPSGPVAQTRAATITGVRLNGPARGFVGEKYRVTALLTPKDAVDTTTFVWSPAPVKGQGTVQALYRWSTPGKHAVKVTATDQTGAVYEADMLIDVVIPETTAADAAAIGVAAATVPVDAPLTASLVITPATAGNVSIIWSPFPDDGQGKRTATFTWATAGSKEIGVAVINPDGTTIEAQATVEVTPRGASAGGSTVFLPFLARAPGVTGAQAAAPEIIGGREAVPGAWPWQAALLFDPDNGRSQFCGGALIDPNWVLTAAHCVVDWNAATTLYVLVGRHDLSSNAGSVVAVTRILVHPQYNDGNSDADIALLQLARPLADTTVSLATVPFAAGDVATVIGWGTTVEGVSSSAPDVLMQVEVPIVSTTACTAAYGGSITANMLCAGRGGADSCQGDSGGPLMVPSAAPSGWTQIGVVSFGNGCGRAEFPGVYARVAPFVDWIAQQTGQTTGTPDAYEPDDTRAAARAINVGDSQVHTIHVAGDVDWLQFTVPTAGSYVLETSNLGANADTQLALFDATGTLLAEDDDGGDGLASRLEFTGETAAGYFARVNHARAGAGGAATDYTVSVRRQPGSDADAFEPDNDAATARIIATDGTTQTHNFHVARDADWVRFTAQAGATYAIETANLGADADTFIELYDARLSQIAVDDDGGDGRAARLDFAATSGGIYFVRATNYDENAFGPATQYDLRITAGAPPAGNAPDAFEPDDVADDATDIAPDGSPQRHTMHVPGDVDYIRFAATAGTTYVVATTNLGAASDTVITLYDGALTPVAEDDDGNGNAASRIEFVAAASQSYSVRIRDANPTAYGAATQYDVSVTAPAAPGAGDAFEPDDTPATAASIPTDGTRQSHDFHVAGDQDWARFVAEAGYRYVIETVDLGPESDTVLHLFNAAQAELGANDDGGEGSASRLEYAPATSETLYVRVTHYSAAASGPDTRYDLRVTAVDQGGDAHEPDDSMTQASTIATDGSAQAHTFHQPGDVDWIRFSATAGQQYIIATSDLGPATDTVIALYDADHNRLQSSDDDGEGLASRIVFVPRVDGTLYVRIAGYDPGVFGDDVRYAVSVGASAPGNVILDPSFEEEPSAWEEVSFQGYSLIYAAADLPSASAQDGDRAVWLGGVDDEVSYVRQEVTVPPATPYLHYYHWIASEDACGYDFGGVGVNGYWLMDYDLCVDTNTGGWEEVSADLRAYAGETIVLALVATTDGQGLSNLLVDNLWFASGPVVAAAAGRAEETIGGPSALTGKRSGATAAPAPKGEPVRPGLNGTRYD